MSESSDEFDEIIKNNNLEKYLEGSSPSDITIKEIHEGISSLGETIMYAMDFVHAFFMSHEMGVDKPGLTADAVIFLKSTFEAASAFNENVIFDDDDDDDDSEDTEN